MLKFVMSQICHSWA